MKNFIFAIAALFALTSCTPDQILAPQESATSGNAAQSSSEQMNLRPDDHQAQTGLYSDAVTHATIYFQSATGIFEDASMLVEADERFWAQTDEGSYEVRAQAVYKELTQTNAKGTFRASGFETIMAIYTQSGEGGESTEGIKISEEIMEIAGSLTETRDPEVVKFDEYELSYQETSEGSQGFELVSVFSRVSDQQINLYFR